MPDTPAGTESAESPNRVGTAAKERSSGRAKPSGRSTRPTRSPTTPDTLGEYFATWIERHPRSERTNATYEHRVSRVTDVEIEGVALERLADARTAPPPHPRPGRPHADERRSSHHRRRRHPPLPLGDGRGRDHRRSLRPQSVQGHPRSRQRSTGTEETPPDPRLQLRRDAPLREGRRSLRGAGPRPSPTPA